MNKKLFPILSAFLLLFSLIEKGQATETYRPETSVAGFIQLPGSGRQVYNFNPEWKQSSTNGRQSRRIPRHECLL